ncbi:colicin immunity protein Cui [Enterobacter cloacae]|uniref:colicin immunity protein Cui n=1 Tax=Enterobacter cloacae TaxID=550 RepID=UPI0037039449
MLPFLWIFFTYVNNPESTTLNVIAASTSDLPAVSSANNPLLSKVMDAYTKTAPLFAFILFISSIKGMHIRSDKKPPCY